MLSLGHLDANSTPFATRQLPTALKAGIGPFKPFDGKDRPLFDHHALTNLDTRNFLGDSIPKTHIFQDRRRHLGAGTIALTGHDGPQPRNRFDELNPILGQFLTDPTKKRVRIPLLKPKKERRGSQVGFHIKEVLGCDPSSHNALIHSMLLEKANHFPQLADLQPNGLISLLHHLGIGFSLKGHHDQLLTSSCPEQVHDLQGQGKPTRNQPNARGGLGNFVSGEAQGLGGVGRVEAGSLTAATCSSMDSNPRLEVEPVYRVTSFPS